MELILKLNEGERFNNFTVAEAIYNTCISDALKGGVLDASVIAKMILEQYWADSVKEEKGYGL